MPFTVFVIFFRLSVYAVIVRVVEPGNLTPLFNKLPFAIHQQKAPPTPSNLQHPSNSSSEMPSGTQVLVH
jgi:hypothetical protein